MSTLKPKASENVRSNLLNNSENSILFDLLGSKCQTLSSAVVQLLESNKDNKWHKTLCGVACFVKDGNRRSYFIKIYDIRNKSLLWEQEIYHQFRYKTPRDFFHTFETDSCQAGLNFASEDEAIMFRNAVELKLTQRHQRRLYKKNQRAKVPENHVNISQNVTKSEVAKTDSTRPKKVAGLSRKDIGMPTDFRHVKHVGWDLQKGEMNIGRDMRQLIEHVGVAPDQLDQATIDFINDFLGKNGGIDAIKNEISMKPSRPPAISPSKLDPPTVRVPPPTPSRKLSGQSNPPHKSSKSKPPPLPTSNPAVSSFMPRPEASPPPPPKMPPRDKPSTGLSIPIRPNVAPPPMVMMQPKRQDAPVQPPQPSGAGGLERCNPLPPAPQVPPPPPRAPPVPVIGQSPFPPPPPTPPPPPPPTNDLLPPALPSPGTENGNGRSDLLKDLCKGSVHLKKIEVPESRPVSTSETDGLVGALAKALAERQKVIYNSDEDDSDEDDEWDDD